MHPQTVTFPPPCFIVGIWYLGSKRVPWGRRIHCIPFVPNSMYLNFISPKDIFPLFLGPVLVRLRPFHTRLLLRDHRFLDGAFSIQSSCLKPTSDSFGFWGSQSSHAMSTAVRRGWTREKHKMFLLKRRDVELGRPDLGTFGTTP
ncbi:hypothetical protein AVEN_243367-1 [Araneus ventricosus]|uniref:Uncharacterized protein n=1 Tax=Araneus ventricosus TaxID=182803 RepID=A0A4Y2U649_ARAVE|nr:hypothetical protein AVEN_243367-1 [Araneus ventricosus]